MNIDLQLQVYFLAGVFGIVSTILIFFMAAICGRLEKLKKESRRRERQTAEYDNYAYNCPTIQPGEELNRRGYSMYGGSVPNNQSGQQVIPLPILGSSRSNIHMEPQANTSFGKRNDIRSSGNGTRDASNDFSHVISSETFIVCGSESLDKISDNLPPPPPPKVLLQAINRQKTESENAVN